MSVDREMGKKAFAWYYTARFQESAILNLDLTAKG